jgi:mono/diheme cytochrome c family protein
MSTLSRVAAGMVCVWGALAANVIPGDARRGEQLFQSEQCVQCHSVDGRGGKAAPDLGKRIDRNFTPAVMASLMWNHAPDMWAGMKKQGIVKARMSEGSAADLFAYFVSARFFEKPGDAGRGKQAFAAKKCAGCHGVATAAEPGAPPVAKWESLSDPIALAQQMWNHGGKMKEALARKNLSWMPVTAQELTDILVYLQNLPETRHLSRTFSLPATNEGAALFASKGCEGCHTGRLALEARLSNRTITEIAASMWNHQPSMKNPPPTLSEEEMRQVLAYIWARQYFKGDGSADRGKKVFAAQSCATCHNDASSGAPKLGNGKDGYSEISMVSVLWEHGPRMHEAMNQRKLGWPQFKPQQMSDLIAYLNTL